MLFSTCTLSELRWLELRRVVALAILAGVAACLAVVAVLELGYVWSVHGISFKVLGMRVADVDGVPALVVRFSASCGERDLLFELLSSSGRVIDVARPANGSAVLKLVPSGREANILSSRRYELRVLYKDRVIYNASVRVWGATPIYIELLDLAVVRNESCGSYVPKYVGLDVKNLGDTPLYVSRRTFIIEAPGGACYIASNYTHYVVPPHGEKIVKLGLVCPHYSCGVNKLPTKLRIVVVGLHENVTVEVHSSSSSVIGVSSS